MAEFEPLVVLSFYIKTTGKVCTVNDTDQTVVMLRPKFYIGSSGSVWASDYMSLGYTCGTLL